MWRIFNLGVIGLCLLVVGWGPGPLGVVAQAPQPDVGIPELAAQQFQIGAAANGDGAAVGFWVAYGEVVKVQHVAADGSVVAETRAVVGCAATQATVAIGGQWATVFLLCEDGVSEVVRFELGALFPSGATDPCWVFLPLVNGNNEGE